MSSALTQTPEREFNNKEDRCDRCGAPARTYAEKVAEQTIHVLFFCGHHSAKAEPKLAEDGWLLVFRKDEPKKKLEEEDEE